MAAVIVALRALARRAAGYLEILGGRRCAGNVAVNRNSRR